MSGNSSFIGRKVSFHTLGCKLNFVETSFIGKQLFECGFERAKKGEVADVCIINTCSVTEVADRKGRQAIKQMVRQNPGAYVIVTGCYAQLKPEEIADLEGVDLVLGMNDKFNVVQHLADIDSQKETVVEHTKHAGIKSFFPTCTRGDRTRYFLKVQDGCDYFCTYCTIPIARGKSRSASVAETVHEAELAAAEGAKEIVITGVNIGDFGHGTNENFFDLVKALDEVEGIERYRISSIEPNLITDEIIAFCAQSKRFVPHFHIPLQSGSNDVLEIMKRRYKRELYAERVAEIKRLMPDAFIGVDVIVGTRGETAEFFQDAVDFIKSIDVQQLHVFSYSERPNTAALKLGGVVSVEDKKHRSEVLHELSEQKRLAFYQSQQGRSLPVLWEEKRTAGAMHGFTANYVRVERPYDKSLVNKITTVRLGDFNADKSALIAEL